MAAKKHGSLPTVCSSPQFRFRLGWALTLTMQIWVSEELHVFWNVAKRSWAWKAKCAG